MKKAWLLVISTLIFYISSAQDYTLYQDTEGVTYKVWTASNYDSNKPAPVLLFLHGSDRSMEKHNPAKYASEAGVVLPMIVIAPSCSAGCSWNEVDFSVLLDHVESQYLIDRNRIYLTGYSMGGHGSWSALTQFPDLFAAASPICGSGNTQNICKAKNVYIKAYHGDKDSVSPYSRTVNLVNTLKDCTLKSAELVTYSGADHWIWPEVFKQADFYEWLLSKSK